MTVVALPSNFELGNFLLRLAVNQRSFASNFGGSEQVADMLNDRWAASLALPPCSEDDAGRIEAFIAAMRGMANTVNLWHFGCPHPRGSMRGNPTAQAALQGAGSVVINTTAAATLRAGDPIGINGLLLMVAQDAVANGAGQMTVQLVNRLRKAIAGGAAVAWNRPTVPFRLVSSSAAVQYTPGYADGVSLDFVEDIAP